MSIGGSAIFMALNNIEIGIVIISSIAFVLLPGNISGHFPF
jgi:hypothetical protein